MREHQIGIALYCALGTGCRSGAEFRLGLRVATTPSSHEDHPRPPSHSGGSWPLYMLFLGLIAVCAQQSTGVVLGHVLQVLDVVAGPRVLAGPVQPPPRLAVLLVAGYPVMPGDVPTLGVNLPVQQPRADGLGRRLDKFPGVGYPRDLDKLATHELTLMEVIEAVLDQTRSDSGRRVGHPD